MSGSPGVPTGEKREGTVPALVLRAVGLKPPFVVGTKSGKPSWLGDSGIFSRNGVEWPLVGGPQILGEIPSCAWISRALHADLINQRSASMLVSPTVWSINEFQDHEKGNQPLTWHSQSTLGLHSARWRNQRAA